GVRGGLLVRPHRGRDRSRAGQVQVGGPASLLRRGDRGDQAQLCHRGPTRRGPAVLGRRRRGRGPARGGEGAPPVCPVVASGPGWGRLLVAGHVLAFDLFERPPALGIPNDFGVPEPPERVHWDEALAKAGGGAGPYDSGP